MSLVALKMWLASSNRPIIFRKIDNFMWFQITWEKHYRTFSEPLQCEIENI